MRVRVVQDQPGHLPTIYPMNQLRYAFVLFLAFTVPAPSTAQRLDSLLGIWEDGSRSPVDRATAYQDYIWDGFMFSRPDTAEVLAEALHAFAELHQYPEASAIGYNMQGTARAIQGDLPRSLDHYQKSLLIYEELKDEDHVAAILNNISKIHLDMTNYPLGLGSLEKARIINEKNGNRTWLANNLNNMATAYLAMKDVPKALEYLEMALRIDEEIGDSAAMANILMNIGNIQVRQGDHGPALENLERSLALFDASNDQEGLASAHANIGNFHFQKGDNILALTNCQKALAVAETLGSVRVQLNACECLYQSYKAMGRIGPALDHYERMILLRDSMYNEENTRKITQLEMQYEFDKKEAATTAEQEKKDAVAAQELKRQKLVRNGIGGGLAFALLFLGVVWRQRNKIAKARKRSDELLLNILPEEVAEELKAKGSAEAVHIDQVTVLFTDFKGFTAMSETLSPQELVRDLNECFSAFDHITAKYGIEKIKTIGDAYMAAGGLPTPNTTHATDVIQAAFEMRDFIAEGKARKVAAGLPYFEIRIGVHTGPVVAGIVGVKKFQYDIWGDTVNTASRMESSGEVGQVNISESAYALVRNEPGLTFTSRGKVQAKGKGEMEMYFVRRSSEVAQA
jgi:adenylate cyclase